MKGHRGLLLGAQNEISLGIIQTKFRNRLRLRECWGFRLFVVEIGYQSLMKLILTTTRFFFIAKLVKEIGNQGLSTIKRDRPSTIHSDNCRKLTRKLPSRCVDVDEGDNTSSIVSKKDP